MGALVWAWSSPTGRPGRGFSDSSRLRQQQLRSPTEPCCLLTSHRSLVTPTHLFAPPALCQVADAISELKLGNGTSILIFANIASALPTSVGAALTQAADKDSSVLGVYALSWFLTTLGIVYVQDAERQIPIQYASRYRAGALQQQAYLPFKVGGGGWWQERGGWCAPHVCLCVGGSGGWAG